jgi:hypothetical protein
LANIASPVRAQSDIECEMPRPLTAAESDDADESRDDGPSTTPVTQRDLLRSGLEHLVRVVATCKSEGDFETMSRLVSERYLGQVYGGGPRMSRESFLSLASALPTPRIRFREFGSFKVIEPGKARANVKLIVGNQVTYEQINFVEEKRRPGHWLIDSIRPLRVQPPRNRVDVEVTIANNRYAPDVLTADNRTVNIRASNSDADDHELLVLQFQDGVTIGSLIAHRGPDFPEGVTYLGQVTIPARSSGNIVLVGLRPGTYVIVDLLPSANGVPHLSLGMQATLTVTAPVDEPAD